MEDLSYLNKNKDRMADIIAHSRQTIGTDKNDEFSSMAQTQNTVSYESSILEGQGSNTCSCRITDISAFGEPSFTCMEAVPGECMYRVGSEPSTRCLYCLDRFEGDRVRQACVREEAQDYAQRQYYIEQTEKDSSNSIKYRC